jgi:hypothetical protein
MRQTIQTADNRDASVLKTVEVRDDRHSACVCRLNKRACSRLMHRGHAASRTHATVIGMPRLGGMHHRYAWGGIASSAEENTKCSQRSDKELGHQLTVVAWHDGAS